MLDSNTDILDGLWTYMNGKLKRYNLLFAVNGAAFVIATIPNNTLVLEKLTLSCVALGAIVFTALMVTDIWLFGEMMRTKFLSTHAFQRPGKAILLFLGSLLIAA